MNPQPVTTTIPQRFSCRSYAERPLEAAPQQQVRHFLAHMLPSPLGTATRFELVAANAQDREALRGLGTYGFIRGATGFIVGAMGPGTKNLEDYGYQMEQAILYATGLGLGSCWLGGSFTKSSFAHKIRVSSGESVPAVTALGYIADEQGARNGLLRRRVNGSNRLPWERLFFEEKFDRPLSPEGAAGYAQALEMVRLGPSATNRQPWRLVRQGNAWHFYLQRTPGYRHGLTARLFRYHDLQRLDLGIAMCHFALTARELGLAGRWMLQDPELPLPNSLTEYSVTWVSA